MKSFLIFSMLLYSALSFGQDSTFRCNRGSVEVKRIGISKIHHVDSRHQDRVWITGKVKRIDYEYTYTRTFHGCTRPANPKEFYKPIKAKSFYFVPVEDIVIYHGFGGPVYQSLSLDSLILRSYYKDGTPQNIFFLNDKLQVDSIYRFYENGKLKTRVIGGTNQVEDNLVLNLDYTPELSLRRGPIEWTPDYRSYLQGVYLPGYHGPPTPSYPLRQDYCHGNGSPQVVITWHPDSVGSISYHQTFDFFDPEGERLDSNRISPYGKWTGVRYRYYKSGVLESISNVCDDRRCGIEQNWNPDGTLSKIDYISKKGRDSIVYYKQLPDTLFSWKPPMDFKWGQYDVLTDVIHKHCKLGFNNDGSVRYTSLDGSNWQSYKTYKDEHLQLEHFGSKDTLGFPHGRWIGVNALQDTVYEIHYHHGWLHGPYRVNNSSWESNWTRSYVMGLEIDSSVHMYKGALREIHYFSSPGTLAKKAHYGSEGQLRYIDTVLNDSKLFRLQSVTPEGWICEIGRVDTATQLIHTVRYSAPDTIACEFWTDYRGNRQEWKDYGLGTGILREHWKNEGIITVTEATPESGEAPKQRAVRLTYRWTYDEAGVLLKKERLENGAVVDE